jgi:Ecdysteroid kinase-like family
MTRLPWTARQLGQRLSLEVDRVEVLESSSARDASALLRLRLHGAARDLETNANRLKANGLETVILKTWNGVALQPSARAELRFFLEFAPEMRADFMPQVYAAHDDGENAWMLTQDLTGGYAHPSLPLSHAHFETATLALAKLHAHWWQHPRLERADLLEPVNDVTRMPQALPEAGVRRHAALAEAALETFRQAHETEFSSADWKTLERWLEVWGKLFLERTRDSRQITLLHGDFHLTGNSFFRFHDPMRIKLIDWAQHKRGIGAHDLMYMLLSAEDQGRLERDEHFIARYHAKLLEAGVTGYALEACRWDYRFCLLSNLFQSVFQNSPRWLRRNLHVVRVWSLEGWRG